MKLRSLLFEGESSVTLYHYVPVDQPTLVLEPLKFGEQPYTKREMMTSSVPRVFFYANLQHEEQDIKSGKFLYRAEVNLSEIYDLNADPLKLKDKNRERYGVLNMDVLLETISGWRRDKTGSWVKDSGIAKGVRYGTKDRFDIVVWFEPILVTRVDNATRHNLPLDL